MNNKLVFLSVYACIGIFSLLGMAILNPHLQKYVDSNTMVINIWTTPPGQYREYTKIENTKRYQTKNVLFIIVDDLRPQLGAYIDDVNPDYFSKVKIRTPNLDKLASRSIVFRHAYAQQSLCGPSRASMLTSRRPDVTRVYTNKRYWRETGGNFTTLPQHMKNNGYLSLGFGKVFHPKESSNKDDPPSWSEPFYGPAFSDLHYMPRGSGAGWASASDDERKKVPLADDNTLKISKMALQRMAERVKNEEQPFFMAVGFRKPHLSLVCPEKFYHWYPLEPDKFLANITWQTPRVKPTCLIHNTSKLGDVDVIAEDVLRHLRRAYFACISYMDANVGELLDEVDRLGLVNNTIVSFVADHGYHLGENAYWGKMSPSEFSNRIPMMIHIPGSTDHGITTDSIVEAVDLFPTLVEATGLSVIKECPINNSGVHLCTQGVSLLPLIHQPAMDLKGAAFSQVTALDDTRYTIRTNRFRYVERAKGRKVQLPDGRFQFSVDWDNSMTTSALYDHQTDQLEQYNLVHDEQYQTQVTDLRKQLHNFVEPFLKEPKLI